MMPEGGEGALTEFLVIGGTGMLGRALMTALVGQGREAAAVARTDADYCLDIGDAAALTELLERLRPKVVINAAAMVDLRRCETEPAASWIINARPAAVIAAWSRGREATRFVQISTDHFYVGDGACAHDEAAPITLVNDYARSKYAAEAFARLDPTALVLRTAIIGPLGREGRASFVEWVQRALRQRQPMTLFTDAYFSPIHVADFARACLDLIEGGNSGVLNLAGRQVVSKAAFIRSMAAAMGVNLDWAQEGSVSALVPQRGDSLGLDVTAAEQVLGYALPSLDATIMRCLE